MLLFYLIHFAIILYRQEIPSKYQSQVVLMLETVSKWGTNVSPELENFFYVDNEILQIR